MVGIGPAVLESIAANQKKLAFYIIGGDESGGLDYYIQCKYSYYQGNSEILFASKLHGGQCLVFP